MCPHATVLVAMRRVFVFVFETEHFSISSEGSQMSRPMDAKSVFLLYALLQFRLGIYFLRSFFNDSGLNKPSLDVLPKVTIQLPVFNEKNVVLDLLNAIEKIDYPRDLLQVQILDDSTDETSSLISLFLKNKGLTTTFEHISRDNRAGFKAGALAAALKNSTGDYIAIFDADFIPPKDFLINTLPYFKNPQIAFPYNKYHCTSWNVNQAAAIVICSEELANTLDIDQKKRIFHVFFPCFCARSGPPSKFWGPPRFWPNC